MNNNLHILTLVQCGYSLHPDSIWTSFAYEPMVLFDVFTTSTGWDAVIVDTLWTDAVDEATGLSAGTADAQGWDHRAQMCKTPDNSMITYLWTDSDTAFFDMVQAPDIFGRCYDVSTGTMHDKISYTRGTPYDGANFWMYVGNKSRPIGSGGYEVPVSTTTHGAGSLDICTHYYVNGIESCSPVGIPDNPAAQAIELQNYPNPFSGSTTVSFTLRKTTPVKLIVTDLLGRTAQTMDLGVLQPGTHFTALDCSGYAAGVYVYSLQTNDGKVSRRMTVQ
jgi:hypothetical protein